MEAMEVLIQDEGIIIKQQKEGIHSFSWEEVDELEVAFDVVRRLSGAIGERNILITIKEKKK